MISQPALYGVTADPLTLVNLNAVVVSDVHRTKVGQVRGKLAWDVLELYNDAVRAVGRERDVLVIDAASRLPKSSQLFYDFVHFTNEGARELARIVSEDLCSFLAKRFPDFVVGPCPVIEPLTVGGERNHPRHREPAQRSYRSWKRAEFSVRARGRWLVRAGGRRRG